MNYDNPYLDNPRSNYNDGPTQGCSSDYTAKSKLVPAADPDFYSEAEWRMDMEAAIAEHRKAAFEHEALADAFETLLKFL